MPSGRRTRASSLPTAARGQGRNIIAERLYLARHHHTPPLTAEALSDLIFEKTGANISANVIIKIENGLRAAYDYEVRSFADILGISTDWLLGRDA